MRTRLIGGIAALALLFGLQSAANAVGPIVSIEISPSTATVTAGTKTTFSVIGKDAAGVTADLTANSTFTMNDAKGTLVTNAYTAGAAGVTTVRAKYDTLTADATVTVTPGAISEVVVNPNSDPERIENGKNRNFLADAFDAFNNPVNGFTVDWSVEGGIGTITSTARDTARFSATNNGDGRVVAKVGEVKGFVDVVVAKSVTATNTNANANGNTNATVSNVNVNRNTNAGNVNADVNANENVNAVSNTNASSNETSPSECRAWSRTTWSWLYVAYLVLLAGSLWAVRRSKPVWWWVAPFLLTVAALWIYFQFRCYPIYPGLPYLILLAAVVGASWYTWQRGTSNQV